MIGTVIQNQFLEVRDYPLAASLSFVLMAIITARRAGLRPRARHRGAGLMRRRPSARLARVLDAVAGLVLLYLFLPIFVIVLYSFNKPAGQVQLRLEVVLARRVARPVRVPGARTTSMKLSLQVAAMSTLRGDHLRHAHRARPLPLPVPRQLGRSTCCWCSRSPRPRSCSARRCCRCSSTSTPGPGFATIVIAHIMFSVSYVALTVRARIRGFDWTLEEAAMDLGAHAVAGVLQGHAAAHRAGHRRGRDARASPSRSTTSSSRCSTPAAGSPTRCTSTAPGAPPSRRRSTSWPPRSCS